MSPRKGKRKRKKTTKPSWLTNLLHNIVLTDHRYLPKDGYPFESGVTLKSLLPWSTNSFTRKMKAHMVKPNGTCDLIGSGKLRDLLNPSLVMAYATFEIWPKKKKLYLTPTHMECIWLHWWLRYVITMIPTEDKSTELMIFGQWNQCSEDIPPCIYRGIEYTLIHATVGETPTVSSCPWVRRCCLRIRNSH